MKRRNQSEIMANWKPGALPLLSIACPAYNHQHFIGQTLDSFLMQETDFPFEIIVHDDASTDGTADVIRDYHGRYPAIIRPVFQTINQFSQGKKPASIIIPASSARYIAFCEGDDYWTDPLKLQIQVNFLESHPEYVITYHDSHAFNEHGVLEKDYGGATRDLNSWDLQTGTPIYTMSSCFRNQLGEFPPEYFCSPMGDLFLWSILGTSGKGKFLGQIQPAMYRVHSAGLTSGRSERERLKLYLLTICQLFGYHHRLKHIEVQRYFQDQITLASLRLYGDDRSVNRWIRKVMIKLLTWLRCNYNVSQSPDGEKY